MTVSTTTSRVDYTGNGVTVIFAVPFPFIQDSYLVVVRTVIATGAETTLTLDSPGVDGYSVSGAGDETGSVTVVTAPATTERLSIIRNVAGTQEADFVANDPFPAETFEDSLDKLQMQINDGNTASSRSPRLFPGDIDGSGRYDSNGNRYADAADGVNAQDLVTVAQLSAASSASDLYIQAGTGAQARTVQSRLRDIVSVKDFGAVGDGSTDDTAAIQNAINYAETLVEAITANYDIATAAVYIPGGRYKHTGLLLSQVVDGVCLVGDGAGVSVLEYDGAGASLTVGTEVGSLNFSHIWLRDLTLRGGDPPFTSSMAAIVAGSEGVRFNRTIRNCGMERCQVFGFETNIVLRDCWTLKFRDCHVHDASLSHIVWQTALNGEITGCRFDDSGATAVVIDGQDTSNQVRDFRVVGCVFQESEVGALRFIDVTNAWIESNHFENNNQSDAGTHYEIEFIQGTSARVDGTLTLANNYYSPGAATWTGTERCVHVDAARHVTAIGERTGSSAYNNYMRADAEVQHVELIGGVFTNMPADPVSRETASATTLREAWTITDTAGAVTETVNRHTVGTREIDIGRFLNGGITTSTGSVTTSAGRTFYNLAGNNQSLTLQSADCKDGNAIYVWKYSTSGTLSVVTEGAEQIELNGSSNNQAQLAAQRGGAWFVADGTKWTCLPGDAGATWALAA